MVEVTHRVTWLDEPGRPYGPDARSTHPSRLSRRPQCHGPPRPRVTGSRDPIRAHAAPVRPPRPTTGRASSRTCQMIGTSAVPDQRIRSAVEWNDCRGEDLRLHGMVGWNRV